ncbi:NAD-dependent epimerase/dehydratase family protein [Enterovirga sp. CN4-39]|uniref:NAD-dependent epimerase/dehydratase family protein n=1 Tax=Enterovirga sp. CN4-39 TaxID=3400910 RepID=UPI003C0AB37F
MSDEIYASAPGSEFAGLRCLVLGGSGFLGKNLCRSLALHGANVTSFGRRPEDPAPHFGIRSMTGSFHDQATLSGAVKGQDVVFHLISGSIPESSNQDPSAELRGAPLATIHFLDLCRSNNVKKIVFASSGGAIYGIPDLIPITEGAPTNPISAYGIGKLIIEKHLSLYNHLYGLNYHVLRISNPYGRYQVGRNRQGIIGAFLNRALDGLPLEIWGAGDIVRDFIHVDDVSRAFIASISYDGPHRVMNIGSGRGLSVNDIIDALERELGGGRLARAFLSARPADVPINILDTKLAREELGWAPSIDLVSGLRDTIAWLRDARRVRNSD